MYLSAADQKLGVAKPPVTGDFQRMKNSQHQALPWAPKVWDRGGMSGTEPPQGLIFEAPGPHLDAPRGPLGTLWLHSVRFWEPGPAKNEPKWGPRATEAT